MTPDIHPEDLLDRERAGNLSAAERARLDRHLVSCSSCRIERMLALDFASERDLIEAAADSTTGAPRTGAPELLAPELLAPELLATEPQAPGTPAPAPQAPTRRSSHAPRPAIRRLLPRTAVTAAALLLAGGAAALSGGLAWIAPAAAPMQPAVTAPSAAASSTPQAPRSQAGATQPSLPEGEDAGSAAPDLGDEATLEAPTEAEPSSRAPTGSVASADSVAPRNHAAPPSSGSAGVDAQRAARPGGASAAARVFEAASLARREGKYEAALKLYQQVEREFPGSVEASTAKALRARIELDLGRAGAAATAFKAASAEDTPLTEVALVGEARALQRAGRSDAEARVWKLLIQRFPGSVHRPLAEARLRELSAP